MLFSETSPPPLLTEADLIALMEKHGIGTECSLHVDKWSSFKKTCLDVGDLAFLLIIRVWFTFIFYQEYSIIS